MENIKVAYVFNTDNDITELKIAANNIEQRNGWVLALWEDKVVGGVKEEHLKAFYLEVNN